MEFFLSTIALQNLHMITEDLEFGKVIVQILLLLRTSHKHSSNSFY